LHPERTLARRRGVSAVGSAGADLFLDEGIQIAVRSFASPSVLALARALTLAAVLGKQACRLGVLERGASRCTVAFGMIPRGEVSLISATVGRGLVVDSCTVISSAFNSAILVMVIVTTAITPPLLSWSLKRSAGRRVGRRRQEQQLRSLSKPLRNQSVRSLPCAGFRCYDRAPIRGDLFAQPN
jgi:hypothetical protein